MNFVGDESLEARLIAVLQNAGHHVLSIHDQAHGSSDEEVLARSVLLGWPLITNDKDFGDLVFRRQLPSVGVLLLRFPYVPTLEKAAALSDWLQANSETIPGHYVVLGTRAVRIRPLPQ